MVDLNSLMERALAGDQASLGTLLDTQRPFLKLLARLEIGRQIQGKVGASDVVQEAFLKAHRQFSQFQGSDFAQFESWLRAILAGTMANTFRHYLGTQARNPQLEREIQGRLDESTYCLGQLIPDPRSSPSQQVAAAETKSLVAQAMAQLPDDYQEVLVLRHLEGLTFPQIAERMGRTVDSVEKLWLRAITRLRRQFSGAGHD